MKTNYVIYETNEEIGIYPYRTIGGWDNLGKIIEDFRFRTSGRLMQNIVAITDKKSLERILNEIKGKSPDKKIYESPFQQI